MKITPVIGIRFVFCIERGFDLTAALDEEYVSTYVLATLKGCFFVVFTSGVAQLLIVGTSSCDLQGYRLCCKTEYIYTSK